MNGVVPVGFERMLDDILVGMIVENGSSGEARDFDVVAHTGQGADVWGGREDGGVGFVFSLILHFTGPMVRVENVVHDLGFLGEVVVWGS